MRSGAIANASASAARLRSPPDTEAGDASGFTENRCRNSLSRASRAQSCAVVVHVREIAAQHQRLAQRFGRRQHRLLLDARDDSPGLRCTSPRIERNLAEQRAQQR